MMYGWKSNTNFTVTSIFVLLSIFPVLNKKSSGDSAPACLITDDSILDLTLVCDSKHLSMDGSFQLDFVRASSSVLTIVSFCSHFSEHDVNDRCILAPVSWHNSDGMYNTVLDKHSSGSNSVIASPSPTQPVTFSLTLQCLAASSRSVKRRQLIIFQFNADVF